MLLYSAWGQQLRNCIPVGIHLTLIRGMWPRINQSQSSFCLVKVWLYNNVYCSYPFIFLSYLTYFYFFGLHLYLSKIFTFTFKLDNGQSSVQTSCTFTITLTSEKFSLILIVFTPTWKWPWRGRNMIFFIVDSYCKIDLKEITHQGSLNYFDLRTLLHYLHFIQVTNPFIIYSHLSFRHVEPCSFTHV